MQGLAITLMGTLVASCGTYGAPPFKAKVLEGILQLLEVVQWGSICVPDACSLLSALCQLAASEGRLSGTSFTSKSFFQKVALPILDNYGRACAVAILLWSSCQPKACSPFAGCTLPNTTSRLSCGRWSYL
jgi:hypothetical protein